MKKRTREVLSFLLFSLLILTFLSGSIKNALTPHVVAMRISAGSIELDFPSDNIQYASADLIEFRMDAMLDSILPFPKVYVAPFDVINQGDIIFEYDKNAVDKAFIYYKQEYITAKLQLISFKNDYNKQLRDVEYLLDKARRELESALTDNPSEIDRLQKDVDGYLATYNLLTMEGICNGTTYDIVEFHYLEKEALYSALLILKNNNYQIVAPAEGTIVSLSSNQDVSYSLLPLNAHYQLTVDVQTDNGVFYDGALLRFINNKDPREIVHASVSDISAAPKEDYLRIQINLSDSIPSNYLINPADYSIKVTSQIYSAIVPNIAFVSNNEIYILQEDYYNGKTTYTVRTCFVEKGLGNANYTPCISGLSSSTYVVTAWDRMISDGMEVVLTDYTSGN